MIINENILKQFMLIPKKLVEITNKSITEVEDYRLINSATNLVVGKVLTKDKHPNAEKLTLTTVDIGTEVLSIVCGAANVAAGQYVIVAKIGATLPNGLTIKPASIRGIASEGMICSLSELGLSDAGQDEGIFAFDDVVEIGSSALDALGQSGFVLELSTTPNRADLLSHYGFAKDFCSINNQEFIEPIIDFDEAETINDLDVYLDTSKALRYYARKIDVVVGNSPWFIKSALLAAGIRPINNVVDITNYVMLEYGIPLHAFAASKLKSKKIVVRRAKKGEKCITLDEQTRVLDDNDIVVTDEHVIIAIAGVMGSYNSRVDEKTKTIVLEAAAFDKKSVGQTSRKLNLRSESSTRFERGVDQYRVLTALQRAAELLSLYASGHIYQGIASHINNLDTNPTVLVKKTTIDNLIAKPLRVDQILRIFDRLNYDYSYDHVKKEFLVCAPSYRNDILLDVDVVEEIIRVYGIDKIPTKPLPILAGGMLSEKQLRTRNIRLALSSIGFNETISYSLTKKQAAEKLFNDGAFVDVLKPISEDHKTLRQSLLSGLLDVAQYNTNRYIKDLKLFELGATFTKTGENTKLAMLITGKQVDESFLGKGIEANYYYLKSILDILASKLNISLDVSKHPFSFLHPGISGQVIKDGENIGYIGKLHPLIAKDYNLDDTYALEVDLLSLISKREKLIFEPISKYPSISRDISFIIKDDIEKNEVLKLIKQTGKKLITDVKLFDIYDQGDIAKGYVSLAVSITFNDRQKTLETNDVEKLVKSIKNRLQFEFKAQIRD